MSGHQIPQAPGPADAAFRPSDGPGTNPLAGLDSDPRPLTDVRSIADPQGAARASVTAGVGQLHGTAEDCDCGHGDLPRVFHPRPCPRAGLDDPPLSTPAAVVGDGRRLAGQLLAILGRDLDPASLPPAAGLTRHELQARLVSAGYHVEQVLRDLDAIAALPVPPPPEPVLRSSEHSRRGAIEMIARNTACTDPACPHAPVGWHVHWRRDRDPEVSARRDREATSPASQVATTGGPDQTPDPPPVSGSPVPPPGRGIGPGVIAPHWHRLLP